MMSVVDPGLSKRVSLRYSIAMIPLTLGLSLSGLCSPWLMLDGTALNAVLLYRAWKFYDDGNEQTARMLFRSTLWHLPGLLVL